MFLITDLTRPNSNVIQVNDIRTIWDIIIDITTDNTTADDATTIAGYMRFNDEFIHKPYFKIACVKENTKIDE